MLRSDPKPKKSHRERNKTGFQSIDTNGESPNPATSSKSKNSYQHILLSENESRVLIEKFMGEINSLRLSDAMNVDFSFRACLSRLITGYDVTLFSYTTGIPAKAQISADGYGITVKEQGSMEHHYKYSTFSGIILGALSSTFEIALGKNSLNQIGLDTTDCFSLLNKHRAFDIGTHSDKVKYDICIVFTGYLCATCPIQSAIIPFSKYNFTLVKVKTKVRQMA